MILAQQIEKLNKGEHVVTYQLVQVDPTRKPVTGELRRIILLGPAPWEPLASMVPVGEAQIIWNGADWVLT